MVSVPPIRTAGSTTIAAITQVANAGSADVGPVADGFADLAAQVNADAVAKVALRHFARQKAQGANVVGEGERHRSAVPAVEIELRADANQFG